MLPKQFTLYQISDTKGLNESIFSDELDAFGNFNVNVCPDLAIDDPDSMTSFGFVVPEDIQVQICCSSEDKAWATYELIHISQVRDVDLPAIRDKCYKEFGGEVISDEVQREAERRVSEAKKMAPIAVKRTKLWVRNDGAFVVAATGTHAVKVINDFIACFCGYLDLDLVDGETEVEPEYPTYKGLKSRFIQGFFNDNCYYLIDRDAFEGNYPEDSPVLFDNGFKVVLPSKGTITFDKVFQLPDDLRSTLAKSNFSKINVRVTTKSCSYHMAFTNGAEFKSIKVADGYEEECEPNPNAMVREFHEVASLLIEALGNDEPEV